MKWSNDTLLSYSDTLLRLRYGAGKFNIGNGVEIEYSAQDELLPMSLLGADIPTLFPYTGIGNLVVPPQRSRPRLEVQAATLLQSVNTNKPWEEEWVAFWRDHFSLYGFEQQVGAYLPHWDREVIRRYCWGNFQDMLEASASHPSMLVYLNNRSSRAGSANENFARELFELHTLGRNAYLNNLYAQWRSVPGANQGKPQGYIDQDVYEAARAFTGWSIEDGAGIGGGQTLAKTGKFIYVAGWHDQYQKRILATEFEPYAAAMSDGRKVLTLCANHPATAKHLSFKLVKRFVSETPPLDLVNSTAQVFITQNKSPRQLELVFEHLVQQANKLPTKQKQKAKRPMRMIASFSKAVNLPFVLGDGSISTWPLEQAGAPMYGWVSPEGPPDGLSWILSASYIRQRANLMQGVAENWWGSGEWDPFAKLSSKPSFIDLLAHWELALYKQPRPELSSALLASQGIRPTEIASDIRRARRIVGLLACAPSFQTEVILPSPEALKQLKQSASEGLTS